MEVKTMGNPTGETLVFLHGWPDDLKLWSKQVEFFQRDYHCILITLPAYDDRSDKVYDFPELVDLLAREIRGLNKKVTLVGHDWGAYLSYLIEQQHPELISRLITLDVGGDLKPRNPLAALSMLAYQWWLAGAWLLRNKLPKISRSMSQGFARLAQAPTKNIFPEKNYLYYFFWRDAFLRPGNLLKNYYPKVPLLYLYGQKKPVMFHSKKWERMLKNREDCEIKKVDGGHWFMLEKAKETNQLIDRWLTHQA